METTSSLRVGRGPGFDYAGYGEFKCHTCRHTWKSNNSWAAFGQACKICNYKLIPPIAGTLEELFYYVCDCEHIWKHRMDADGRKCPKCQNKGVQAISRADFFEKGHQKITERKDKTEGNHDMKLCELCKFLERPCGYWQMSPNYAKDGGKVDNNPRPDELTLSEKFEEVKIRERCAIIPPGTAEWWRQHKSGAGGVDKPRFSWAGSRLPMGGGGIQDKDWITPTLGHVSEVFYYECGNCNQTWKQSKDDEKAETCPGCEKEGRVKVAGRPHFVRTRERPPIVDSNTKENIPEATTANDPAEELEKLIGVVKKTISTHFGTDSDDKKLYGFLSHLTHTASVLRENSDQELCCATVKTLEEEFCEICRTCNIH